MRAALVLALSLLPAAGSTGRLASLPLVFEPNLGQSDSGFRYLARAGRHTVFLNSREAAFVSGSRLFRLRFQDADPASHIEPLDPLPGRSNYYLGRDSKQWRQNVPQFGRVRVRGVWPGIDVVYYSQSGALEFDFVVAPGADPSRIALTATGRLKIDTRGDLLLDGYGRLRAPLIYQEQNGKRRRLAGRYMRRGGRIGFQVSRYDRRLPLVIDPILSYSTFLGGSAADGASGLAVDSSGNAYVTGTTASVNFPANPVPPPTTNTPGNGDIFVTKLSPNGTTALFSTYIGGRLTEGGVGIAVDAGGNVYVGGTTNSTDFPVSAGAFQGTYRGGATDIPDQAGDAFALKLNSSGSLAWATLLGGSRQDQCFDLAIDGSGSVYLAGFTASTDFPGGGVGGGSGDAFVVKLNDAGTALIYSTLLGGSGTDAANGIALDGLSSVYVVGITGSPNFPTTQGVFQPTFAGGGFDAFIVKLGSTGGIVWASYLGANGAESAHSVALTPFGEAYIAGATSSDRFPVTPGAAQSGYGGGQRDGFVAGVNQNGSSLIYATYAGAERNEDQGSIAIDRSGAAYLAFFTDSIGIRTTPDAFQIGARGSGDVWLAVLNSFGTTFTYSTYLGSGATEQPQAIALDRFGNVYIAGTTSSGDFPTRGSPLRPNYGGGLSDAFVAKFAFDVPSLTSSPNSLQQFHFSLGGSAPPAQTLTVSSGGSAIPFTASASSSGNWLSVSPSSGSTPATLRITANPAGLQPRTYSGTLNIASPASGATLTLVATLVVTNPNQEVSITGAGIINGATGLAGPIAPGEIVSIFGPGVGTASILYPELDATGFVTNTLGGNRVLFDGISAPIIGTATGQVNVVVPYAAAGRTAMTVQVEVNGVQSNSVLVPVAASSPGIFALSAYRGQAIVQNQDGILNGVENPAKRNSVIVFWATGEGQTDPPGTDGKPAVDALPAPRLPVTVWIGGIEADILYRGAAPNFVAGVMQVNARVPARTPTGEVPLVMRVGNAISPPNVSVVIE